MKRSTCTGPNCGREIVWAELRDGERLKRIPLDPKAPVYEVTEDRDDTTPIVERRRSAFVSHFATCPDANRFSGGRS